MTRVWTIGVAVALWVAGATGAGAQGTQPGPGGGMGGPPGSPGQHGHMSGPQGAHGHAGMMGERHGMMGSGGMGSGMPGMGRDHLEHLIVHDPRSAARILRFRADVLRALSEVFQRHAAELDKAQ